MKPSGKHPPVKGTRPCPDDATHNHIHTTLRKPAERADAHLKHLKALQRATRDPGAITTITATALVIIHLDKFPREKNPL